MTSERIRVDFTFDVQDHWEFPGDWTGTLPESLEAAITVVRRLAEAVESAKADDALAELARTCPYCQTFVQLTPDLKCPNCGAAADAS